MAHVFLKQGRAKPFFYRHPWIFSGCIEKIVGKYANGDEVDIFEKKGTFVGKGIINNHSQIRVRLFSWNTDENLNENFFRRKLEAALDYRREIGITKELAYRLVNSEGDGLSGIIIDKYSSVLVVQCLSLAFYIRLPMITALLQEFFSPTAIYLKMDQEISKLEKIPNEQKFLYGSSVEEVEIQEGNVRFLVHFKEGHKTGFYLDQKMNRLDMIPFIKGKRILDLFSYTGAFAIHAAKEGACSVDAIESSAWAIELAKKNTLLNNIPTVSFQKGDVFRMIPKLQQQKELFDVVICDPPKFLRSQREMKHAFNVYKSLNKMILDILKRGGLLITCSCSQLFSEEMFNRMLAEAAAEMRRGVVIYKIGTQSPDHVVSPFCPEGKYLKTFFVWID